MLTAENMDKFAEASLTNPDSVDELEMDKMKYDKLEVKEVEGVSAMRKAKRRQSASLFPLLSSAICYK